MISSEPERLEERVGISFVPCKWLDQCVLKSESAARGKVRRCSSLTSHRPATIQPCRSRLRGDYRAKAKSRSCLCRSSLRFACDLITVLSVTRFFIPNSWIPDRLSLFSKELELSAKYVLNSAPASPSCQVIVRWVQFADRSTFGDRTFAKRALRRAGSYIARAKTPARCLRKQRLGEVRGAATRAVHSADCGCLH